MRDVPFHILRAPDGGNSFYDADLNSEYVVGLTYALKKGNTLLAEKLDQWLSQGIAEIVMQPKAMISGKGKE